jgi:ribonuclease HI
VGLIIYLDGGARGNPGPAGAGVIIQTDDGRRVHEAGYFLGRQTNNAAEYYALLRALARAERCGPQSLTVYSDSELLVRQVTGEYDVKSPKLQQLYEQAQLFLLRAPRWTLRHIKREQNERADKLVNLAIDRRQDVIVFDADSAGGATSDAGEQEASVPPMTGAPAGGAPPAAPEAQPGAAPAKPADADAKSIGSKVEAHLVRVSVARTPNIDICPAAESLPGEFTITAALPAALCIHAAHSILPTVLAMLNTEPQEFATIPTLTVHCDRPGCGAIFHLSPLRSPNGEPPET